MLSRELQIYYSRLTAALLPPTPGDDNPRRAAALASLQHDAGLQNLLPYLVRWVGQSVVTAIRNSDERERSKKGNQMTGETLEILLKVIHALIQNERLFMEPYVGFSPRLGNQFPNTFDSFIKYCLPFSQYCSLHRCRRILLPLDEMHLKFWHISHYNTALRILRCQNA